MVIGGANQSVFFTADEVAGTVGAAPVYTAERKIKTSISRTSFTVDQNEDNPALTTFLEAYAPQVQVTADSGEYENGSKFNSSNQNSQTLLQIVYGGIDKASSKRKVTLMLCKLAQDAGAFDQESGKFTKPKVAGDVVNNDDAISIATTLFDTTKVTIGSAVTIPANLGYKEVWLTAVGSI